MPSMLVTIDGQVVMNGDLGQWTTEPPEILADQLKAGAVVKPWMRALMITMADAAMREQTLTVDVTTRADGWDFSVTST